MSRLRRILATLVGVVLVLVLAGWLAASLVMTGRPPWVGQAPVATGLPSPSGTPATSPTPPGAPDARLVVVADGLASPLGIATAGDDSGRIFVIEQGGRIKVVRDDAVVGTPFLDLSGRISSGGERGLLGLAFHPRFPADPRFFVNYTDPEGDTVVASFRVAEGGRAATADPSSERVLLRIDQPYPNHNGGHLLFGPDGYLYVGTGDGGLGGDPEGNGQDPNSLLGKILRIDVDGTGAGQEEAYAIPPDNPFATGGGAPEVWAYGVRNPWRFTFDAATGDLWVGDVGQNTKEEVDVIRSGTPPPVNLGWDFSEADLCFEPAAGCDASGITLPVASYGHDLGCSVTGGVVARGDAAGSLDGRYLFADFCSGTIWWLDPRTSGPTEPTVLLESKRAVSSFGVDEAGRILLVDLAGGALLALEG